MLRVQCFALVCVFGCASLVSCAKRDQVIIDTAGVDMQAYEKDLAECRQLASQVRGGGARGAVAGAAVGGAVGAVRDEDVGEDAGVGAIAGAVGGRRETKREQQTVQKNCMRNRGYKVLN